MSGVRAAAVCYQQVMRLCSLLLVAFTVLGCGTKGVAADGDAALEATFTNARKSVTTGSAWSDATARLEQQLGPPNVRTETEWRWARLSGDFCYDARIIRNEGADKVNGVMGGKVNAAVEDRFGRCKSIATATARP